MNKISNTVWNGHCRPLNRRETQAQVAALCHRRKGDKTQVLMITSRGTGRWIIPKGWPMDDREDHEAALQEAWEEAGVRKSAVDPEPIGSYTYDKVEDTGTCIPVEAQVYAVAVHDLADTFPEDEERTRKWMDPKDAAALVDEAELKDILRQF